MFVLHVVYTVMAGARKAALQLTYTPHFETNLALDVCVCFAHYKYTIYHGQNFLVR